MEVDFKLREFLNNDSEINKYEFKLLSDYYKCKDTNCHNSKSEYFAKYKEQDDKENNNTNKKEENLLDNDYINFSAYESCVSYCAENYRAFYNIKINFYETYMSKLYAKYTEKDSKEAVNTFNNEFSKMKTLFMKNYCLY